MSASHRCIVMDSPRQDSHLCLCVWVCWISRAQNRLDNYRHLKSKLAVCCQVVQHEVVLVKSEEEEEEGEEEEEEEEE